ncbi:MAG: 4Fe-4S dicluster domain-containing protein, partial [Oscillospiraceae bacterium]|nr:4Fe-4S dicluster domain-containing protein [Oscillospiraceae bacterium]
TFEGYVNNEKKPGATSDVCTECGICEEKCPQKLNIRELLKKAENTLKQL